MFLEVSFSRWTVLFTNQEHTSDGLSTFISKHPVDDVLPARELVVQSTLKGCSVGTWYAIPNLLCSFTMTSVDSVVIR